MNLFTRQTIPPPGRDETVFRISLWGTLFSFLFILSGTLAGVALFIICCLSLNIWGMVLSGLYTLMMWGICYVFFRSLMAIRSPANWLARIGSGGILLKYRSYLHDDSPVEDPIALQLSWAEIADAHLQQELCTTTDMDGKSQVRRWFLAIRLDSRYLTIDKVKAALEFEARRQPAHFRVDDLKHELFMARKNHADDHEIAGIKNEIEREKMRHPGKQSKMKFLDRPIVFISPDLLRMEWTHITPGKKKLQELLTHFTSVIADQDQHIDIEKPMAEAEFISLLNTLLSREEKIEAIKLARRHKGLSTTEAKAFIEKAASKEF